MGSSKSKEKKKEDSKPSGRVSAPTAWDDPNGRGGSRVSNGVQKYKSSSAPTSEKPAVNNRGGRNNDWANQSNTSYNLLDGSVSHSNDARRNGNSDRNWANQTNTSYNLLDGTVSHTSNDFKSVQISSPKKKPKEDKFSNFRGMTDYRNEKKKPTKRRSPSPRRRSPSPKRRSPSPKRRSPKKKLSPKKSHQRRHSDISTLELDTEPAPFRRVDDKPKFSESYDDRNRRDHRRSEPKRRAVSNSPPRRTRTPPRRRSPPRRDRSPQRRRHSSPQKRDRSPPSKRNRSPRNYRRGGGGRPSGVSNGFTNLSNVKSASSMESAASAVSNYETRTKVERFNDKKESLRIAKLSKIEFVKNQFSDHRVHGSETYSSAKDLMSSDDWEKEVKGLEMIVAISRDRPEMLRTDMKTLLRLMMAELKNLRSQVCRAAGQAMSELFLNLGMAMELDLEKTTPILMQRAADTNKFIRESCNEALDVMVENVSVYKGAQNVFAAGFGHKSVVVRTTLARLMDKIVTQLGAERLFGSSKDLQEIVIGQCSKLLTDGCQDVRKFSRHMFGEISRHEKFPSVLKEFVRESERKDVMKVVDSIK